MENKELVKIEEVVGYNISTKQLMVTLCGRNYIYFIDTSKSIDASTGRCGKGYDVTANEIMNDSELLCEITSVRELRSIKILSSGHIAFNEKGECFRW